MALFSLIHQIVILGGFLIVGLLSVNYISRGVYDVNSIVPFPVNLKKQNNQNIEKNGFDILKYSEDFDFSGNQKIAWMGKTYGNPEVFWATMIISLVILLGVNFSVLKKVRKN